MNTASPPSLIPPHRFLFYLHSPHSFLSSSSQTNLSYCSTSRASSMAFLSFTCTSRFVLVPLSSLVLFNAIQRQRQRPLATTTISNGDLITYNILALELINLLACGIYLVGMFTSQPELMRMGLSCCLLRFSWTPLVSLADLC